MPHGTDVEALEALLELLKRDPCLVLRGECPGRVTEVRWAAGELLIHARSVDGHGDTYRREPFPKSVDRRSLAKILAAGRAPGAVREHAQRSLYAAKFVARLLDLIGPGTPLKILEMGAGRAPLGLALLTSLARAGRSARLEVVDTSSEAIAAARALAESLGLPLAGRVSAIRDFMPAYSPDLLLAVHVCGEASLDTLAVALACGARSVALVPCCAPLGMAARIWAVPPEIEPLPDVARRLDALALVASCARKLTEAGYGVAAFETYLPPWRAHDLAVAAYLWPSGGKTMGRR